MTYLGTKEDVCDSQMVPGKLSIRREGEGVGGRGGGSWMDVDGGEERGGGESRAHDKETATAAVIVASG